MRTLRIFIFSLVVLSVSIAGCDSLFQSDNSHIVNERGVLQITWGAYIIEAENTPKTIENTRTPFSLFPINLPDNFKEDGLHVVFSANIEECGERATCIASPVTLTKIRTR